MVERDVIAHFWPRQMVGADAGQIADVMAKARDAVARWQGQGLPHEEGEGGEALFDPFEVRAFAIHAARGGRDPLWRDTNVVTRRRCVEDQEGASSTSRVTFQRTVPNLDSLPPEVVGGARLRVPFPWEDGTQGAPSQVKVTDNQGREVPGTAEAGRLTVALADLPTTSPELDLLMTYDLDPLDPDGRDGRVEEGDRALYTRPEEGLVRVSEGLQAVAREVAPARGTPLEVTEALWDHVFAQVAVVPVHHDELATGGGPLLEAVLAQGRGDCLLTSSVFVALCRARGLAARVVGGYLLDAWGPVVHHWAEVLLPDRGFATFDLPLSWTLAAGEAADVSWSRRFFAKRGDLRVKTECRPRIFVGPPTSGPGVRATLPPRWVQLHEVHRDGAMTITLTDAMSGALFCRDRIRSSPAPVTAGGVP